MLLYLVCLLLAGCLCHSSAEEPPTVNVLQNTKATLPCPHKRGNVLWKHHIGGPTVIVDTKKGREGITNKHYDFQEDNSLVILNVKLNDSAMYWCNGSRIYLKVTKDVNAEAAPLTPGNTGRGSDLGPGNRGRGLDLGPGQTGAADTEDQQSSDFWKIPVGVFVGAALVLTAVLTQRFCSKQKAETNADVDTPVTEVIYEEIEGVEEQQRAESEVETPYWTSVSYTQVTSTTPRDNNLYSIVNKLRTDGRSREECVYYLAQSPAQTGSDSDQ